MRLAPAAVGIAVAVAASACGGRTYDLTAPSTTTIEGPSGGALVRCTNHGTTAQAKVPGRDDGVGVTADGARSSASLQLTRTPTGALVVSCDR